jgi:hypothetical protein
MSSIRSVPVVCALCVVGSVGCGYPALGAGLRSVFPPDVPVVFSCVEYPRDPAVINQGLKQSYEQGWRLVLWSDYTSTMKSSMTTILCLERPANVTAAPSASPRPATP